MAAGVVLDTSFLILEDGFDPAFFNGGQRELSLQDEDAEAEE
jgi:hypothetical protein